MHRYIIGVVLELLATVLGTVGKQLVSYSARVSSERRARRVRISGLTVTTLLGPLCDASAYAFAAQAVVAPLNGLDVVWNTLSAPFTLGERLQTAHVVGTLLIALGASLTAALGPHPEVNLPPEILRARFQSCGFFIYAIVFSIFIALNIFTIRKFPRGSGSKARAFALGATAGSLAGNMFFLSCFLAVVRYCLDTGDWSVWLTPFPYLLIISAAVVAVSNVPFIARGLQEYDALFMVTLFEGCHITIACISSQVVMHEIKCMPLWRQVSYGFAVALIIIGLFAIQTTTVGANGRSDADVFNLSLQPSNGGTPRQESLPPVVWAGSVSGVWSTPRSLCGRSRSNSGRYSPREFRA